MLSDTHTCDTYTYKEHISAYKNIRSLNSFSYVFPLHIALSNKEHELAYLHGDL